MRRVTQEAIREERLVLARLEEAWERLNRPQVSRDLRDSLYTKLLETRANLSGMESRDKKPPGRRAARQELPGECAAA